MRDFETLLDEALAAGIRWREPNFDDEVDEYFENDYTRQAFARRGFNSTNRDDLMQFLENGRMTPITREELASRPENLTITDQDFTDELQDPVYARNYASLENALKTGPLSLPAPIIIDFGDVYYGFSGNRRSHLAYRNNLPLKVWLVDAKNLGQ